MRLSIEKYLSFGEKIYMRNVDLYVYKHQKYLSFFFRTSFSFTLFLFLYLSIYPYIYISIFFFCVLNFLRQFSFKTNRSSLGVPVLVHFVFYLFFFVRYAYHPFTVSLLVYVVYVSTKNHTYIHQDFEN